LSAPQLTETDAKALLDDFRRAMRQGLDRLYDDLRLNPLKTLLSKEVAVAIAAPLMGGTAFITSGVGSVLGGGARQGVGRLSNLSKRDVAEVPHGVSLVRQGHPALPSRSWSGGYPLLPRLTGLSRQCGPPLQRPVPRAMIQR
jgi:hypothetical protein